MDENNSLFNDLLFCCLIPIFCDDHCLLSYHLQTCVHSDCRFPLILYDRNDLSDDVLCDHLPSFRVLLQCFEIFAVIFLLKLKCFCCQTNKPFSWDPLWCPLLCDPPFLCPCSSWKSPYFSSNPSSWSSS